MGQSCEEYVSADLDRSDGGESSPLLVLPTPRGMEWKRKVEQNDGAKVCITLLNNPSFQKNNINHCLFYNI